MSDTIKIEQSTMVDTNPRVQEALQHVLEILKTRAKDVVSVKILSNFSIDHETTLKHNKKFITSGLVVCVTKNFKFNSEDVAWFHPSIGQGRSVFSLTKPIVKDTLNAIEQKQTISQENSEVTPFISDTNCKFGEYIISKPDEFGCQQEHRQLIVDTNADALLTPLFNKWLENGTSAGEIATQWKRLRFNDIYSVPDKTKALRMKIAETVAPGAELTYNDTVNDILTDSKNVFVLNQAVKVGESKTILMNSSSLGGYRLYNSISEDKLFFPASMGTSTSFYDWNSLSPQNCSRIENTCLWSGDLTFNTQVMRPPSIKNENLRDMENEYSISLKDTLAMAMARFSASDSISDKLTPEELFKLTPTSQHVSNAKKYIATPLTMDHEVTQKLMQNIGAVQAAFPNFEIFNSKVVKKGRLRLPHKVFEFLLK